MENRVATRRLLWSLAIWQNNVINSPSTDQSKCSNCGLWYWKKRSIQKYCSDSCRHKAWIKSLKERACHARTDSEAEDLPPVSQDLHATPGMAPALQPCL